MPESALLVSQSGRVTHGLQALVTAREYDHVETLVTHCSEDNEFFLAPETIERVEREYTGAKGVSRVLVVDGWLHPGQAVDLQRRLPSVTLRDRRELLWAHLSEQNPVARTRLELRRVRLARREAAGAQRDGATQSPSGTSGHVSEYDRQRQELRVTLERRQDEARERVQKGYTDVDGHVVLVGRVGAPTTALWATLTGESATPTAGHPAQPATATMDLGPHTLAVTDTPGVLGTGGLPESLTEAVPGLVAALEQASSVLGVGPHCEGLRRAVSEQFETAWHSVAGADAGTARDALREGVDTAEYAVQLPYADDAHALVSALHDSATVHTTEYEDAIYLHAEVAESATAELRRRVSAVGGEITPLDRDE
jgi:50S ribosomal subunit-associated GTPase HflX